MTMRYFSHFISTYSFQNSSDASVWAISYVSYNVKANGQKNLVKTQWLEPSHKRQKGMLKDVQHARTKKKKKLVFLLVGNYFTHIPSNVVRMQIVRSNLVIGGLEQASHANTRLNSKLIFFKKGDKTRV
jgi:hypothetical protein